MGFCLTTIAKSVPLLTVVSPERETHNHLGIRVGVDIDSIESNCILMHLATERKIVRLLRSQEVSFFDSTQQYEPADQMGGVTAERTSVPRQGMGHVQDSW